MPNQQIIKGGAAVALILTACANPGVGIGPGQWCCAQPIPIPPLEWIGAGAIPGAGASNTTGSGILSRSADGTEYMVQFYIVPGIGTNSEHDSQLFLNIDGQFYGSQEFDLVDMATPPAPTLTVAVAYN